MVFLNYKRRQIYDDVAAIPFRYVKYSLRKKNLLLTIIFVFIRNSLNSTLPSRVEKLSQTMKDFFEFFRNYVQFQLSPN